MSQQVFLLRHEREVDECDGTINLGVFSTLALAEESKRYFETQRGFVDYVDGFVLHETASDQRLWSEGFVTWDKSLDAIKDTP